VLLFGDSLHFFEADFCDLQRGLIPEIFAEKFEREPAVVADFCELTAPGSEVEDSVAREYAVGILLKRGGGLGRAVIEVRNRDLIGSQFCD